MYIQKSCSFLSVFKSVGIAFHFPVWQNELSEEKRQLCWKTQDDDEL